MARVDLVWSILVGIDLQKPLVVDAEVVRHLVTEGPSDDLAHRLARVVRLPFDRPLEQRDLVWELAAKVLALRQRDAFVEAQELAPLVIRWRVVDHDLDVVHGPADPLRQPVHRGRNESHELRLRWWGHSRK